MGLMIFDIATLLARVGADSDTIQRASDIVRDGRFEAAAMLMDDELREAIHARWIAGGWVEDDCRFLIAYSRAHQDKFGEAWAPLSGEAW